MSIILRAFQKLRTKSKVLYIYLFCKNIRIGRNLSYRRSLTIRCSKDGLVLIGENVFFNSDCSLNARRHIQIGSNCIFGEGVRIYDHNHVFNRKDIRIIDQGYSSKPVIIGDNCWIGSNVVILAGTSIGDNSVISAGCVVSGFIPKDVIVRHGHNSIEPIIYQGGGQG